MKCPTCPEVKLTMTERQGIEIDYCPECRGVWLDRGELDKLIEKSTAQFAQENRKDNYRESKYDDRDRDDYKKEHYYKKRKSFLSEIFD
jgi:Zn-finger nucleic acid-binding protein